MSQVNDGVLAAFDHLWKAIKAKFLSRPEYKEVYLYEQVYLEGSDHLQQMADNFVLRGTRIRRLAYGTLIASFFVISIGILVFLTPTRFADIDQTRKEINSAIETKYGALTAEAQAQVNYLRARDMYNLYGLFHEINLSFAQYKETVDFANSDFYQLRLNHGLDASGQLVSNSPVEKRYRFESFQYHRAEDGEVSIPAEVFVQATRDLQTSAIDLEGIHTSFEELKKAEGGENIAKAVSTVVRELAPFGGAAPNGKVYRESQQLKERLFLSLSDDDKNKLETVEQLRDAEVQISEALLKVNDSQAGWGSAQPWATLLTVRIGIVVLLLYLTTILLSTYRYTLTLSAYYFARSDALQLLSHQPDDRLIDLEELKTLIPLLSPDEYRIDKDAAPYDSIVGIPTPFKGK